MLFKAYIHREQFKEYINDVTTLEKPFQCSECNITFASAHELWGHQVPMSCSSGKMSKLLRYFAPFFQIRVYQMGRGRTKEMSMYVKTNHTKYHT